MILIPQHPGSGVGDQLFCYLAGRITAERLGVPFSLVGQSKWASFIKADMGVPAKDFNPLLEHPFVESPAMKIIIKEYDWPIYEGKNWYDPEFNFIEDNTIVDGCRCQDERYWEGYPIQDWLKTEPLGVPDDLCILGFRGGEYAAIPELFLPKQYFVDAMNYMRKEVNEEMRFRVVTDDPDMARACFPHLEITHDIGMDWRQMRYARYAIVANSAFYVLPRWLAHEQADFSDEDCLTVAPRYWSRYNTKEWLAPQSYYPAFKYI